MEDWERRIEKGAKQTVATVAVGLVLGRSWSKIAERREQRGRRSAWMLATNKMVIMGVWAALLVVDYRAVTGVNNYDNGKLIPAMLFCMFGVIALLVAVVIGTIITLIVFALIEALDTLVGTQITTRAGHFLTLEEVYEQAEAVGGRIEYIDGRMLGDAMLALVGSGGALGMDLVNRDKHTRQWTNLCELERRLLDGEQIWVND